jgi:hypothetical protein
MSARKIGNNHRDKDNSGCNFVCRANLGCNTKKMEDALNNLMFWASYIVIHLRSFRSLNSVALCDALENAAAAVV